MTVNFDAARDFLFANGRVLDRRLFAVLFEDADLVGVVWALSAYRNPDGGFGHGLEPDKRVPASQPLDVEVAFEYLVAAGADALDFVDAACDWLASIAAPSGAVPVLLPSIDGYPRAGHWQPTTYPPGLNPTAAIAAHALSLGSTHPWVVQAAEFCVAEAEAGRVPDEGHDLLCLTKLLTALPDRERAERLSPSVAAALSTAGFVKLEAGDDSYGVTPLDFAPSPASIAHDWFDAAQLDPHLDELEQSQLPDGGWPVAWQPPGPASEIEWRAILTLHALRRLRAFDRLT